MNSKGSSLLCFAILLLFTSANATIDIAKILSQNPDFSQFSKLITETKVADEINSRQTITVLALNNGAMSSLAGKPQDLLKKMLSVHVVLDYFDLEKITKLSISNKTGPTLTTLFQASGQALNQQGFLTVALLNEGEVAIGSAVKGAPINSMLVKSVAAQPFSISVIQISQAIQVPGIEIPNPNAPKNKTQAPSAAPQAAAPTQPQAPAPSRKMRAPTPSERRNTGSVAPAPTTHKDSSAAAPTESPVDDQTPTASTPSGATTPSRSPMADAPAADAQGATSPNPSSAPSQKVAIGFGVLMALVSFVSL